MGTYLLINLAIILVPFAMSFEGRVRYYSKFKYVFPAIAVVAIPYLLWDALATYRGDWGFNERYVLGLRLFYLPVEEILFFVTVPFSSIFIYEAFCTYFKDKSCKTGKSLFLITGLFLFFTAFLFIERYYTFTVLLFSGMFLFSAGMFYIKVLRSRLFWIFTLFMYIPFFIVNYLLTSLPVVKYNPGAITGIRISTIPVEDFFYSFSMLSFYLLAYLIIREKWQLKIKSL